MGLGRHEEAFSLAFPVSDTKPDATHGLETSVTLGRVIVMSQEASYWVLCTPHYHWMTSVATFGFSDLPADV